MEIFACSSNEECMLLIGLAMYKQRHKKKLKLWVRDLLKQRKQCVCNLVREIAMADKEIFFRYMRMSPSTFEILLQLVGKRIVKKIHVLETQ